MQGLHHRFAVLYVPIRAPMQLDYVQMVQRFLPLRVQPAQGFALPTAVRLVSAAGRASGTEVGSQAMRARWVSSLLRQEAPPLAWGVLVAASFIVVETALVYLLKRHTPGNACGIFYLPGVLVVSTVWGFGLAVTTSLASAVAFAGLCSWPAPFMWAEPDNLVMITTFLVVALSANCLAYVARARAIEADQRRREAEASNVELTASRVRIVAAVDDARRRLERDLHDGAQQRLVSLGLELRAAEASVPADLHPLREQISDIVTGLAGVSQDLQEISRGIHPAILSKGGLGPALKSVARRSAVPVELDVAVDRRLPESAEVAAYYVVAEALTNAAKHAQASEVFVCVKADGANLRLSIRDDGIGGADSHKGSGLIGLTDRVEALGGHMQISSPAGRGTTLVADIPLEVG
jgi:signal transduction histidine kinase